MEGLWSESEQKLAQQMLSCTLVGSQKTVAMQFEQLHAELGADEYMVVSYIYDINKQNESYRLLKPIIDAA